MKPTPTGEELALLTQVVEALPDDTPKLVYADWLDERGDSRADFLRRFVQASRTRSASDLPDANGLPEEWLELIGYRLIEASLPSPELRDVVLRLARPALRLIKSPISDAEIPIGASKIGGQPDLPPSFSWPLGRDCRATYNKSTAGVDRLAGFLAQINLADLAGTQAGRLLPAAGLLSFFSFQDIENDDPDVIGVMAALIPEVDSLTRTDPPKKLTLGNTPLPAQGLTFAETLDLPGLSNSPWQPDVPEFLRDQYRELLDEDPFNLHHANFENLLGYARATSGDDPTPSKDSRHLILLKNEWCNLHIQIPEADLAARRFDKITLQWVDFD